MKNISKVTVGIIEYRSIAKGLAAADKILKASNVDLIFGSVLCPGKYIAIVAGDISSVLEAERTVTSIDGEFLISTTVIPDIDQQVFSAITATTNLKKLDTVGVLETSDAVSAVAAADKIAKSAHVELLEIRLARGLGGKGFVFFNGELSAVEEAMRVGVNTIAESGTLIAWSIIPNACPEILL